MQLTIEEFNAVIDRIMTLTEDAAMQVRDSWRVSEERIKELESERIPPKTITPLDTSAEHVRKLTDALSFWQNKALEHSNRVKELSEQLAARPLRIIEDGIEAASSARHTPVMQPLTDFLDSVNSGRVANVVSEHAASLDRQMPL